MYTWEVGKNCMRRFFVEIHLHLNSYMSINSMWLGVVGACFSLSKYSSGWMKIFFCMHGVSWDIWVNQTNSHPPSPSTIPYSPPPPFQPLSSPSTLYIFQVQHYLSQVEVFSLDPWLCGYNCSRSPLIEKVEVSDAIDGKSSALRGSTCGKVRPVYPRQLIQLFDGLHV